MKWTKRRLERAPTLPSGLLPRLAESLQFVDSGGGSLPVLFADALVDLSAMYGDLGRRLDAKANLPPLHLQDGDPDLATDNDALPGLSRQYQHLSIFPVDERKRSP